jgi:hypothetical protein
MVTVTGSDVTGKARACITGTEPLQVASHGASASGFKLNLKASTTTGRIRKTPSQRNSHGNRGLPVNRSSYLNPGQALPGHGLRTVTVA